MARLGALGGNFTSASSWATCSSVPSIDSELGTLTITNSTTTHVSPNSAPGAITIDGIYIKISSRPGVSGTMTVALRNTTAGSDVTTVVISIALLPTRGWVFFKFAAPQLLLNATNYAVRLTCSVSNSVIVYRSTASAKEFTRLLRMTTTAAPSAGDQLIVTATYEAGNVKTAVSITMDNTATTIFGSTTYSDSLSVSTGGTLDWGVAASTNYLLRISGNVRVFDGGTWNQGTSGARIPSTSTAKLLFVVASNVDGGFTASELSTVNCYGNIVTADSTLMTVSRGGFVTSSGTTVTRISGQSFIGLTGTININTTNYTISSVTNADTLILTTTYDNSTPSPFIHVGTANILTVASTAGWAAGDTLGIASTSQTPSNAETAVILTVDSATQVTLTTALGFQHSGDSPTQAEVIHFNRNVVIAGTSTVLQSYVSVATTAIVNHSYAEFYFLGSNTAATRGMVILTTTGSYTAIGCICRSSAVVGSRGWDITAATSNNISITYCHVYSVTSNGFSIVATNQSGITIDHCIAMRCGGIGFSISDIGFTFTNCVATSMTANTGMTIGQNAYITGTFSNLLSHSNSSTNIFINGIYSGTMSNLTSWRGAIAPSFSISACYYLTLNTVLSFGNSGCFGLSTSSECVINDLTIANDVVFASGSYGILNVLSNSTNYFNNFSSGVVSGIFTAFATADISHQMAGKLIFKYSLFASATEIYSQTSMVPSAKIISENHDQVVGVNKRWERFGTAISDTVTYRTASPAESLSPLSASFKFKSTLTRPIGLANGQSATVTVYIYKSVAYNGSQPRLILQANEAIGISSDTVLATAVGGTGSWLTLSGVTPTASGDGAFVCYVDCDGTAGTVTVDDWSVA